MLIVPRHGRAIEVADDPVAQLQALNDYLARYATRAELIDAARVFASHLAAASHGAERHRMGWPFSAALAADDLPRWADQAAAAALPTPNA